jgi:hypothetical protein
MNRIPASKQDRLRRSRKFILFLLVVIAGLIIFLVMARNQTSALQDIILSLESEVADLSNRLRQKSRELVDITDEYQRQQTAWEIEKTNYEELLELEQKTIDELKAEIQKQDEIIKSSGNETVEKLIKDRDEKRAELAEAQEQAKVLQSSINDLEAKMKKNLLYFETVVSTYIGVFNAWKDIHAEGKLSDDASSVLLEDPGALNTLSKKEDVILKKIQDLKYRLDRVQKELAFYEENRDNSDQPNGKIDTINLVLKQHLADLVEGLEEEEQYVLSKKSRFSKRYLLVASTRDLASKKILMHQNGSALNPDKLPRRKKYSSILKTSKKSFAKRLPWTIA